MKKSRKKVSERTLLFEWINDDDDLAVSRISKLCFGEQGMSEAAIHEFMDAADHIPKVLKADDEVVGYAFYTLHKRVVMLREIAVTPLFQRKGYGTFMLQQIQRSLPTLRRRLLAAEVAETNLPAQLLFKKCGILWQKTTRHKHEDIDYYVMSYESPARNKRKRRA